MLAGIAECGIRAMSLADNGMVYTGRLHAFEAAFEANLRALGTHTINSSPPPANVRQNRAVLADAEEVAPRPPRPATIAALNHCWTNSAASTTTTARTGRCAGPHPPRRSRRPHPPGPPHVRYPHRYSSPATPSANSPATCSSRPTKSTSDLRWAGHQCDSHPPRRPHRHLQRHHPHPRIHRRPHTQLPAQRQNHANLPPPRTQTHIMSVSDVPRHKCQRCPETPHSAERPFARRNRN